MDEALVKPRWRADSGERLQRAGPLLGITTPWSLAFFFTTIDGLETMHIYLWVRTRTKQLVLVAGDGGVALVFVGLSMINHGQRLQLLILGGCLNR